MRFLGGKKLHRSENHFLSSSEKLLWFLMMGVRGCRF
jgi:hypothetical protein